jgi:hypothetical protein
LLHESGIQVHGEKNDPCRGILFPEALNRPSMPPIFGMEMSTTNRSGCWSRAILSISSPSSAVATTSKLGSRSRRRPSEAPGAL